MFGARYWGHRTFGVRYWGGTPDSQASEMFGDRYWGKRFFGPRYWGGASASAGDPGAGESDIYPMWRRRGRR